MSPSTPVTPISNGSVESCVITPIREPVGFPLLGRLLKSAFKPKENFAAIFVRDRAGYEVLDGFRGATIMTLVLFHCLFGLIRILEGPEVQKLVDNIPPLFHWAWQARGSDCMFLVCGLLLGMILWREYKKTGTINISRFFFRRSLRIIPLFLIALFLYLMVDFERNIDYLWSNLLFLTNVIPGQKNIIPVGWSLVLQIQFYLIVPFLTLWLVRSKRRLFFLALFFILAAVIRSIVLLQHPNLFEIPLSSMIMGQERDAAREFATALYYAFPTRMGPFFIGMLLAVVDAEYGKQIMQVFKSRRWLEAMTVGVGAFFVWLAVSVPMHDPTAPFNSAEFNKWINLLYLSTHRNALTLGLSMLLLAALHGASIGRWINCFFSGRFWYPFAQLVYPIYLFHFPFIVIAAIIVFQTTDKSTIHNVGMLEVFLLFLVSMTLTVIFSIIAHLFVERPAINLRN